MGLCSFVRRILAGQAQEQPPRQDQLVPAATKFGLAAIFETQAAPASDLITARPSFLTVIAAQPETHPTSLSCSPRAPSPPQTVSYQGYFGLHDSVPTPKDHEDCRKMSLCSDKFRATQAWDAASQKYWAWVSDNSHALFLAEKEALTQSQACMVRQLQRSSRPKTVKSCLAGWTRSLTCSRCMCPKASR
ncbi:hypothetical protein WJX74_004406 [Apatococcus lobatus]|uniref:Uncharacterized protein n=1 Tax=Apatococcus lobatus TaxID=904363 RepID=A0AAW1RYL6_9CHLO